MAAPFSSTSPIRSVFSTIRTPLKSFLSHSDCFQKGRDCFKCRSCNFSVYSLSSSASYTIVKLCSKPIVVNHLVGNVRCATIEEIEAEKSSIENEAKEKMEKTIETVRTNFNSIRTGRANPAMLDKVEVEYYGTPVSLKSIAQISTPDSSSLLVQPYDKSSLKAIEKAIVNSDLGMTPNNDGEVIRMSLPQLTTERRKEFSKIVAKQAEEGKEKKLSEDNVKDLSNDLQKLTDEYMKKIDSLFKQKEKELLTV
ncbi:Ribosome-recycling factor [Hibiscus syriacus]|uniref:Ribosome-recycling factor, chloroplastic n=1 Tax=Hibiscus syriacus TaxID=106335 RepID=A0A6A2WMP9_HIBSY|nr:Ribosome-recycling factor [Hibiscus syriacus]